MEREKKQTRRIKKGELGEGITHLKNEARKRKDLFFLGLKKA